MYSKITKRRIKWLMLFKHFFQLFIAPLLLGVAMSVVIAIFEMFLNGFKEGLSIIFVERHEILWFKHITACEFIALVMCLFGDIANVLSVPTFIKLIADCFTKNDEEVKEIAPPDIFPYFELQCIRQSKRFMCDTFMLKQNMELYILDENRKKYRLLWNEKYGDKSVADVLLDAKKIKIFYLKRSKIIFKIEILEG